MAKRTRFISRWNYNAYHGVGDSTAPAASLRMSNSTLIYPIEANSTSPRLYWTNHRANFAAGDSALSVKAGVEAFSSGLVSQGAVQQVASGATLTIPQTTKYLSAVLPITTTAQGQYLKVYQWVDAGSGNKVPGTRKEYYPSPGPEQLAYGASLTAVTDGTLSSPVVVSPGDDFLFAPMVVGQTTSAVIGAVGHSLVRGVGADYERGWLQVAAEVLGVPCVTSGVGGATVTAIPDNDLDFAAMCTTVLVLACINDINNAGGAGTTSASFLTSESAALAAKIATLKSYGCNVVVCTEGLNETGSGYTAANVIRADWNAFVRSYGTSTGSVTGGTGLGADLVFDLAASLETSVGNNTPVSGVAGGIHWGNQGHIVAGTACAAALTTAGYHNAENADYREVFLETFDGSAGTSGGASFAGFNSGTWTQFGYWGGTNSYANDYWYKNGTGGLSLAGTHALSETYLNHSQSLGAGSYKAVVTLAPFKSQSGTSQATGICFAYTGSNNGIKQTGYTVRVRPNSVVEIHSVNSSYTQSLLATQTLSGGSVITTGASGDRLRLEVDWTHSGTATDITVRLYRGKTQLGSTMTVTGNTATGLQSGGRFALAFFGDSGNTPSTGEYFRSVYVSEYAPVTIGSVTVDRDTLDVEIGGTRPVQVTVLDDTDSPVSGESVSASYSGDSGITVTSSATTDASGIATFYVAASTAMAAADSGTITFTCDVQTDTLPTTVVAVNGLSGTASGGAEMTINETVTKAVTTSWSEVVDGTSASIGGKSYMFGFAAKGQVIEFRVAASAPSDGDIGDRVAGDDPRKSDTVASGKKLYVRSKDGNTFNIPVHLSA